jgi:hypothetical protein
LKYIAKAWGTIRPATIRKAFNGTLSSGGNSDCTRDNSTVTDSEDCSNIQDLHVFKACLKTITNLNNTSITALKNNYSSRWL